MESKEDRARRKAAGIDAVENILASELACRSINGTALFMLAHRQPLASSPHVHELAFFDKPLWDTYVQYMQMARSPEFDAAIFGGQAEWTMKLHWNVLPLKQRVPFVLRRARLRVAAEPQIRQPM